MTLEEYYSTKYNVYISKARARGYTVEDAEDITQEAFTRALTFFDSYDKERGELSTWFNRIFNNTCSDFRKAERTQSSYVVDSFEEERCEGKPSGEDNKIFLEKVLEHINKYTGTSRDVLYLYFMKGYKLKEITAVTEEKYGTIRQNIRRFKAQMNEKYGHLFEEGV